MCMVVSFLKKPMKFIRFCESQISWEMVFVFGINGDILNKLIRKSNGILFTFYFDLISTEKEWFWEMSPFYIWKAVRFYCKSVENCQIS